MECDVILIFLFVLCNLRCINLKFYLDFFIRPYTLLYQNAKYFINKNK